MSKPDPVTRRDTRLTFDPDAAVAHLAAVDPVLGALMQRAGPYRPTTRGAPDVFHSLMRAIVYQQLSGKAAGTIHARVLAALGGGDAPGAAAIQATDDASLRGAGLSANKLAGLRALAAAELAGELPDEARIHEYDDAELIEVYSAIRGIGRWTVEMLLLFHLGRADVMPIHDLGVRKGFALTYGHNELPKPKALEAAGEAWRPYRSVACWYMWRALEADGATPQPQ
ncbi:DNA-3-methyladenine glycosylase 2 family protein [Salinisphaera sp.]|uniref:DNA-3-methyladenine glycosylase family protein n=1 Tax=Salinisphaera sp. TaxID=1914330 RepID=UPI002D78A1FC|nr:DNA-3-methyladenine glycosylase 2 family protein [Salinisphaera sp.]HET7314101.1 DNA-3-methyladenine glycosylase 2 family protein [Salinisphaera sp.]